MKKVLLVMAIAILSLSSLKTNAQTKIGVWDEEAVLSFMPGIQSVDSLLQQYAQDSIKPEYDALLYSFQTQDSSFKADSSKMNASLKATIKKELAEKFYKIQNWQQIQQQAMQAKQQELLKPFLERIYKSFNEVLVEQKYTHVLKRDVFYYADRSEELMLRVLHKLNIPLPKEIKDQMKEFGIGGGTTPSKPTTTPTKPATTGGAKPGTKKN